MCLFESATELHRYYYTLNEIYRGFNKINFYSQFKLIVFNWPLRAISSDSFHFIRACLSVATV